MCLTCQFSQRAALRQRWSGRHERREGQSQPIEDHADQPHRGHDGSESPGPVPTIFPVEKNLPHAADRRLHYVAQMSRETEQCRQFAATEDGIDFALTRG